MNIIISDDATNYFSRKCLVPEAKKIEGIYKAIHFCKRKIAIKDIAKKVDGFAKAFLTKSEKWLVVLRFCNDDCDFLIGLPWPCVCHKYELVLSGEVSIFMADESDVDTCRVIVNEFIDILWKEFCRSPVRERNVGLIPKEVFYLEKDGEKWVPHWYVKVGAFLVRHNFGCDPFLSWLAAESWFAERGFRFVI